MKEIDYAIWRILSWKISLRNPLKVLNFLQYKREKLEDEEARLYSIAQNTSKNDLNASN